MLHMDSASAATTFPPLSTSVATEAQGEAIHPAGITTPVLSPTCSSAEAISHEDPEHIAQVDTNLSSDSNASEVSCRDANHECSPGQLELGDSPPGGSPGQLEREDQPGNVTSNTKNPK